MPSTYSPLLRLELMATGEKSATWGDITNTNLGTLLEKSIAGTASVNVTASNVTLTALNGTDDESRCAIINITGTPGVSRNVVAPSISKTYSVINGSNAAVVFKGAATTGVTLAAGERAWLSWNGSDFVRIGISPEAPVFTGQVTAAAGSAAAPSYSFTGDTNTGIYSSGADQLAFSAAGTARATVGTSGLVVLGNAGSYSFRVADAAGTGDRVRILAGAATGGAVIDVTDAGETTSARTLVLGASNGVVNLGSSSQFTKDASGNIGIGGSPLGKFWIQMAASGMLVTQDADDLALIGGYTQAGGTKGLRVAGSNGLYLSGNGANVSNVIINSAGNVGVGLLPNSGWRAGAASIQLGAFACVWTQSNGSSNIGFGLYEGGANTFNYLTTGDAPTLYSQISGRHIWYGAAAGTANAAVSLASRMELNATGDLLVPGRGAFGSGAPLLGGVPVISRVASNQNVGHFAFGGSTAAVGGFTDIGTAAPLLISGSELQFSGDGSSVHARINANGLGVGVTPAATYGASSVWAAGSFVASSGQFNVHSTVGANYEFVHRAASRGFDFYVNAGGTLAARLSSAGQLLAPAIHNNASGASGTTPMLASGTFTPTGTTGTNCSGVTPASAMWIRVGSVVTVFGNALASPTATGAMTFFLSLPIASNLANQVDLSGVFTVPDAGAVNSGITGDTTNDRAQFNVNLSVTGLRSYFYTYSYEVK